MRREAASAAGNSVLTSGWLYQGQLTPVAELDGAGNIVSRFVYATGLNVPDFMVKGGVTYRFIRDHLGSIRLVVDVATGSVAQRIDYDEFGAETQNTNPGWQPFGFAGGLTEASTGLVRFGARDYEAVAGRWTAKDPIGFNGGELGLYGYITSDPVNFLDPSGLWGFGVQGGATGEIGTGMADQGLALQVSGGSGLFGGQGHSGVSYDDLLSAGGFVGTGSYHRQMFSNPISYDTPDRVAGVTLGANVGLWWSANAGSVDDLLGPFETTSVNSPWISVQMSRGHNAAGECVTVYSIGWGKAPLPASLSQYATSTTLGPLSRIKRFIKGVP